MAKAKKQRKPIKRHRSVKGWNDYSTVRSATKKTLMALATVGTMDHLQEGFVRRIVQCADSVKQGLELDYPQKTWTQSQKS